MKYHWIKGIKHKPLRTLKKNVYKPNLDGVTYPWKAWVEVMEELNKLKPGDKIWNPYLSNWDNISNIELWWSPIQRVNTKLDTFEEKKGKCLGKWVSGFAIHTQKGYIIYDTPTTMKWWCDIPEHK